MQLQAVTGLKRLGAVDAAKAMLPLTASPDVVVSNVTIDALVALSAVDASLTALASAPPPVANGALRVLQMSHGAPAVTGLIASLAEARTPELRNGILQALARLHYRDGVWRGTLPEWWGTRPDTTGPYYDPAAWEESARIRGVLRAALLAERLGDARPVRRDEVCRGSGAQPGAAIRRHGTAGRDGVGGRHGAAGRR